ncbi:hypothetical protein [Aestuariivirga sp.]|uniref:hypothetical protein n=1 Tax=Aestuariivirga sp. TaxID=2650926 RepID=UPI003918CC35
MHAEKYKWIRYSAIGSALLLNVLVFGFCFWLVFTRKWDAPLDPAMSSQDHFLLTPTLLAHGAEFFSIFVLSLLSSIVAFAAIAGISNLHGTDLLWLPIIAGAISFAVAHVTSGIDPRQFLDPALAQAGQEARLNPASVCSAAAVFQFALLLATTGIAAVINEKRFQPVL